MKLQKKTHWTIYKYVNGNIGCILEVDLKISTRTSWFTWWLSIGSGSDKSSNKYGIPTQHAFWPLNIWSPMRNKDGHVFEFSRLWVIWIPFQSQLSSGFGWSCHCAFTLWSCKGFFGYCDMLDSSCLNGLGARAWCLGLVPEWSSWACEVALSIQQLVNRLLHVGPLIHNFGTSAKQSSCNFIVDRVCKWNLVASSNI